MVFMMSLLIVTIINPYFSPEITRIIFPDGYEQVFNNQDRVPGISHTL